MKNQKQYTVEDVRKQVASIRKNDHDGEYVWDDILPMLREQFPEQLIIKYIHSS